MTYLTVFCLTLGLVSVKAFQQRNVAHGNTRLIVPTSFVFAALEIPTIGIIAAAYARGDNLVLLILAAGSAAAIGCLAAIGLHRRIAGR